VVARLAHVLAGAKTAVEMRKLAEKSFAMVLAGRRTFEPRDLPIPEIDADSGLLRVEACGICGSDYEQYEGVLGTPTPAVPGHEPVGIIEKVGDRAARRWGVEVGDRVAVESLLSCRHCPRCLAGDYQLCDSRRVYSFIPLDVAPGLWGGYAQYMYLDPSSVLHKIRSSISPSLAALFNPLGAGFRWAVEIPKLAPGDSVAVLGPGQRGLASVLACREAGAGTIIVTGLAADAAKLELARRFGADVTLDAENDDVRARILEATDGRGADIVVEVTSYATAPVAASLDYVRAGGTVVLAGVKGFKAVPNFVSDKIVVKEISVRGAIGVTSASYRRAIRLIESKPNLVAAMHTHERPLADAETAVRALAREIPGEDPIHTTLHPWAD
jgi:threonine dehydrogenase-like Zn-dependent dehydrogenase